MQINDKNKNNEKLDSSHLEHYHLSPFNSRGPKAAPCATPIKSKNLKGASPLQLGLSLSEINYFQTAAVRVGYVIKLWVPLTFRSLSNA